MDKKLFGLRDWQILGILILFAVATSVISAAVNIVYNIAPTHEWWAGWFQNLSTEMFGAVLTFFIIELVFGTRRTKQRLLIQLRSLNNSLALQALEELRLRGCLHDGYLCKIDIQKANLKRADFSSGKLQGINLSGCHLVNADFTRADLRQARLVKANLAGADLSNTNLKGADLRGANLTGADLS